MNRLNELIAAHGVLVAAHRGSAGANIPCNTIPAFDIAMKYGARILEMDICRSTDGKLFVFHTGKEKNDLLIPLFLPEGGRRFLFPFLFFNGQPQMRVDPTAHFIQLRFHPFR